MSRASLNFLLSPSQAAKPCFNFETAWQHSFWPFSKRVPAAMRTPSVQWSVCGLLFCQGIGDALEFEGHRRSADCERNVDGIIIIIV